MSRAMSKNHKSNLHRENSFRSSTLDRNVKEKQSDVPTTYLCPVTGCQYRSLRKSDVPIHTIRRHHFEAPLDSIIIVRGSPETQESDEAVVKEPSPVPTPPEAPDSETPKLAGLVIKTRVTTYPDGRVVKEEFYGKKSSKYRYRYQKKRSSKSSSSSSSSQSD